MVIFQVGYNSDKAWWGQTPTPPKTIGEALSQRIPQNIGIIWVDFSLRDVLPLADKEVCFRGVPNGLTFWPFGS
ncbi:hypothetical protein D4R89_04325 [bacterium]|nr:MAG: hypothetical protein D4R89_04325 [bacterium]